jgi:predicted RNase H-like HicB family nuclease
MVVTAVIDRMKEMSTYSIVVEPDEDGGFFVVVPALPGCFTRGRTVEECRERAVEAIEVHIAGLRALPLRPTPGSVVTAVFQAGGEHHLVRAVTGSEGEHEQGGLCGSPAGPRRRVSR